ncbi:MAG: SCO family protein [Akkermansiaceae bacterium]|nr:SCO family protein [Akkermansiaceae bacterium]
MSGLPNSLEPATRDPKKLRNTAWILVFLAALGSVLVMIDYIQGLRRQEKMGRPPHVARLESNFAAMTPDKTAVGLGSLEGKVWFLTTVCLSQPEKSAENIRVMKLVGAKYADRDDVHFVILTVDPDNDLPEKMGVFAELLGLAENAKWWFLAAGEEPTRGYLKDKLKFGQVGEDEVDGQSQVVFDSVLGVFDPDRNLRGRYDFAEAWEVQEKTLALIAADEAAYDKLNEKQKAAIDKSRESVKNLEGLFFDAVDYVFGEKDGLLEEE